MVSLINIKDALECLPVIDGDKGIGHIDNAILELHKALESLDGVSISGRVSVDALLGCMLAIDMIIGKEDDDGR